MKRSFDIFFSMFLLLILSVPMIFIALLIRTTSRGSVLYWSLRVGKNNKLFRMPKFRTMKTSAPVVATHLLSHPDIYVTSIGKILRSLSLDELPQLFSILVGDMSVVGPRPALYNQDDLIELRTKKGVSRLKPGLTGWAQVNGRDELPIPIKVEFDVYYLLHQSFCFDMSILFKTCVQVLRSEGVQH